MSWNYRVIERNYDGEPSFQIHEVYYDDNDNMKSWSKEPIAPAGGTVKELRGDLMMMRRALASPVLTETADDTLEATKEVNNNG